jgi:hypothetical protein
MVLHMRLLLLALVFVQAGQCALLYRLVVHVEAERIYR